MLTQNICCDKGKVIISLVPNHNVRQKETMKANPFGFHVGLGATTIDIYEDNPFGKIQLQPMTWH